ncbi:MAG: alpha/beta hydrolase [Betaproteobacteria bacterium]|nr:alpha/beta hydrolase [Betaproteobacteria bacterium]NBS46436.1 alpha/beta hydrolase [Betaproteobacteria bacterium]
MYQARLPSRTEFVPIRGHDYHVRIWGEPQAGRTPLLMVHGWMDVGASFQFVVDALGEEFVAEHCIIAPDWRGYGLTRSPRTDSYWFPDYLADLDFLVDHYSPDAPVDLAGHSLGGNIAMFYGGTRPQRLRRLINLEGFGMAATRPAQAPTRYERWLDELKSLHRGDMALKPYADAQGVARRLMKTNRRLDADRALWLAHHWARANEAGEWEILGDAAHKVINPQLFRVDEALEIYKRIAAPVLVVEASDNELEKWWQGKYSLAEFHERLKSVPTLRHARIEDAGHMLHHDQPGPLASLIREFIAAP